jgi:ABC-type taurine transport system substrate-binding protein
MPNQGSKMGKYEHVMKLVNIWMVMKEFAEIQPEVLSRTRSDALRRRRQTDKSNKKLRRQLSKVAKALSNPKDEAMVNVLKEYEDEPTAVRLDECIDFMEECEEDE